ncbi:kinesin-like protein 31E isoform X2 [Brevipalpus obovatus]|uniref:kinesin-like protein 31E isoform X2 n=1 Tax=Brevipalpus obovatus TaxID=246614 RepID=UPI003D9E87B7
MDQESKVKVCVRIRPQIPRELIEMCKVCTSVTPSEPQVVLGGTKAFTFDHVFDTKSSQDEVYEVCRPLIDGCLNGYNATILAYGQTGSGKTFSMGTGFDLRLQAENIGIIPRAVQHLFDGIAQRIAKAKEIGIPPPEFKVNVQFLELYNEQIIDLLADDNSQMIKIHEDASGGIYTVNTCARNVNSVESTLECLKKGSLSRTTASTNMNSQSSRSHAIFTLHIKQQRIVSVFDYQNNENIDPTKDMPCHEFETLTAKFHFVDLAGSERLKRTGATGDRAKEAVSINAGLLALGNVISALGDRRKQGSHVPYRDSKLTRLLQDSLGGNSQTLMIACISPSDRDFMETLNTLRYANRAKNIKNKVIANQDKASETIGMLRREIQQLQVELLEYKQGKRMIGEDGNEQVNDMYHENTMLQNEIANLKTRIKALQATNDSLVVRNTDLMLEKETGQWIKGDNEQNDLKDVVKNYIREIEELRSKLIEMEGTCSTLRKQAQRNPAGRLSMSPFSASHVAVVGHYDVTEPEGEASCDQVLKEAKKELAKQKQKVSRSLIGRFRKDSENGETNGDIEATFDPEEEDDEANVSSPESVDSDQSEEGSDTELQLCELSTEISVKEKLILELEKSQRKMLSMKHHYEDKLEQLQVKINDIETERDRVLAKFTTLGSAGNDRAKKVREDYQQKLNALQSEMKKLKMAEKEHAQAMRSQTKYEAQLKNLKNEVNEMKRQKVNLLKKIKEEAQRHKEAELKNSKKISQLAKQERLKDVKIKNLETETNRFKSLLKRKEDQVLAMKKMIKPMSDKVAGRVPMRNKNKRDTERVLSPRVLKNKWQSIEHDIFKAILNKKSIACQELQMERFLIRRKQLVHLKEVTKEKLEDARRKTRDEAVQAALQDELTSIEETIEYLTEEIDGCQSTIMQLEEAAGDSATLDVNAILAGIGVEEMKYLFDKVLMMAINQTLVAVQKEEEAHEYEMKYNQLEDSSVVQENLISLLLDTTFIDQPGQPQLDEDDVNEKTYPLNNHRHTNGIEQPTPTSAERGSRPEKARRLTKTPQELLFEQNRENSKASDFVMTQSMVNPMSVLNENTDLHRVPSAPSLNNEPRGVTPPSSPQVTRKYKDDDVFSRLTSGTNVGVQNNPDRGVIIPCTHRTANDKYSPLVCAFIAEGHSRPVLSVALTEDVMFSGSKDCTVKIWDIHSGQEIQSLEDHPDAVVKVRYNEYTRLAFSVSKSIIKVWDTRENPARCIKTLNSLGLADGPIGPLTSRAMDSAITDKDHRILDIQVNKYGTHLFSASNHIVRVWDLRKFYCIGKLNTSHSSNVTCIAVEESSNETTCVATGSKDHTIKLFEVMDDVGGIHQPTYTLTPPHYDGIEALTISGDLLFSASRDGCIKRWDLSMSSYRLVHSINQAHKDWIQALAIRKDRSTLISGCRSGFVKLWSADTCQLLGEIRAHTAGIHSIDVNSKIVVTGSADNSIALWTWQNGSHPSPDLCDYIPNSEP